MSIKDDTASTLDADDEIERKQVELFKKMAGFGKRAMSRHLEQEEQERQRKQVELFKKMAGFGKRAVSRHLEQEASSALLESCYLTVIPESHSHPEYSRQVIPLLEQVMSEEGIGTPNVLNVTEGKDEDEFFRILHKNSPTRLILTEDECIGIQTSPEFAHCLHYYNALIVELNFLDALFEVPENKIQKMTGLNSWPLDKTYANDILIRAYGFQNFIPYEPDEAKGPKSFFAAFNTSYLDVISQERRPNYEMHIKMMLQNARTYFPEKCSAKGIDISKLIDELIASGTNRKERMRVTLRQKIMIRGFRDFHLVEYIKQYVTDASINKGVPIRYVIIYVGVYHYTNLLQITQGIFRSDSDNNTIIRMKRRIEEIFSALIKKGASIDRGDPILNGGRKIQKRYKKIKSKSKQTHRRQSKRRRQSNRRQSKRH